MPLKSCLEPPSLWTRSSISSNMICAGYMTGIGNTCAGDSGGPLIIPNESDAVILGVISFGAVFKMKKKSCRQKTNFIKTITISNFKIVNLLGEWRIVGTKLINLDGVWRSDSNWVVAVEKTKNSIKKLSISYKDKVLGVENNGHEEGTRVKLEIYKKNYDGQCWRREGIPGSDKFILQHCAFFKEVPKNSKKYLCADPAGKLIIDGN